MTPSITAVVIGGTVILLIFAVAYILHSTSSHKRILIANQLRLEEVQKSERRFRDLFDNSLAGMLRFTIEDWEILQSNSEIRKIFAAGSQEELQRCFLSLPEKDLYNIEQSLAQEGIIGEYEIRARRNDGNDIWILFSAKASKDDDTAQAVIIDITARKLFEAKITEQSTLLDQTQDAIMVTDPDGIFSYWNSGAELTYGWTKDDVIGQSLQHVLYGNSKISECQSVMEDIQLFGEWSGESRHLRKDGKEILVESRWKRGETASGTSFVLIVNSDITDKRKMESQFIRAQRMESIALLTGGIAHDLQNILAPVKLSTHLLRPKLSDKSSLSILHAVEESVDSGLDLVKNILTYGKGIVGENLPLKISDILRQVCTMLAGAIPDVITIKCTTDSQNWRVSGDANQLKEVFLNLCYNARDAMPSGGILIIAAQDMMSDERILDHYPDVELGPYVVVSISDTGQGIPEENLDKVFEPFFTTKEDEGGTGLGLSIAHGIIRSHSGYITVESKPMAGTTFRVYLPPLMELKK